MSQVHLTVVGLVLFPQFNFKGKNSFSEPVIGVLSIAENVSRNLKSRKVLDEILKVRARALFASLSLNES